MQNRFLVPAVAALAVVGSVLTGCSTYSSKPKYTTEQIMEQGFKGKESPAARVGRGEGTAADFKLLAELSASLPLNAPPKGDAASWKEKSTALAKAGKDLAAGKPGALEAWKSASNCKACHSAHKPD